MRKLNEAEADVKRMEVVEEVVADLIDKVVLFEDLESGNIVTHTVNGISETSFWLMRVIGLFSNSWRCSNYFISASGDLSFPLL